MIRWEAALIAAFGAALGIGLGVAIGTVATMALPATLVGGITIPVQQVGLIAAIAIGAAVLAAHVPARRASRISILAAVAA